MYHAGTDAFYDVTVIAPIAREDVIVPLDGHISESPMALRMRRSDRVRKFLCYLIGHRYVVLRFWPLMETQKVGCTRCCKTWAVSRGMKMRWDSEVEEIFQSYERAIKNGPPPK